MTELAGSQTNSEATRVYAAVKPRRTWLRYAAAAGFLVSATYMLQKVTRLYGTGAETVFSAFAYSLVGLALALCGAILLANPLAGLLIRLFTPRPVGHAAAGAVPLRYMRADLAEREGHYEGAYEAFLGAAVDAAPEPLPYERAMHLAAVQLRDQIKLDAAYKAGAAALVGHQERLRFNTAYTSYAEQLASGPPPEI
jgi:hypothetical protein